MTKAAEMAKVTIKGGFHIMWGLVASTVISAIGTIYLANLLSSDQVGLYALAIGTPNLISVFRDWGVNTALTRYLAKYNSEKQVARTKQFFVAGLMFEVVVGVILTVVSFLLSTLFADLYKLPAILPLIRITSFTILISTFITVAQSVFTGLERMELYSIALIIQSIVKTILIPLLIILGLDVLGAIIGYTIAFLIAGVTSALFMWLLYKKLSPSDYRQVQQETDNSEMIGNIKILLKYGFPLSIAAIIGTFQVQFFTFLMGIYATTDAVGNYTIASTFLVLISFVASPISTMLFPTFSKLDPQKDYETLKNVYYFSAKYATFLVVPVATIVMALSQPGISTLFGNKYASAPLFLTLLAISYLFTAFGSLNAGNFINGQGETVFNLKLSLLSAAIGFPLSIMLTQQFGIIGIIITSLTAGLPSFIISIYWIKKNYNLDINWASSSKIMFSSALAGIVAYIIQIQLAFSSPIRLIIGVAVFLPIFMACIILTRTVNKVDIEKLRHMTTYLGIMHRLLNTALKLFEKLL